MTRQKHAAPIVGLTVQRRTLDAPFSVSPDYTDSLTQRGAVPMLLPLTSPPDAILPLLDFCQGFLLTGSYADVDPMRYGRVKPEGGYCDPRRDAIDYVILQHAERTGKPVFGICRGCQVMNVYRGGTLAWDYHDLLPQTSIQHTGAVDVYDAHTVTWERGSWMAAQMPSPVTIAVNSLHHQVCERVGPGMRVAAVSEDGLIEAIEDARDPSRFFAVQWHPEILVQRADPAVAANILFDRFVAACTADVSAKLPTEQPALPESREAVLA
jgi:putative glutamine amidotransferase